MRYLNGKETALSLLNDEGETWSKIADIIENNADEIFTKSV